MQLLFELAAQQVEVGRQQGVEGQRQQIVQRDHRGVGVGDAPLRPAYCKVQAYQGHKPQAIPPALFLPLEKKCHKGCRVGPKNAGAFNAAKGKEGAKNNQPGRQHQVFGQFNPGRVLDDQHRRHQQEQHGPQFRHTQGQHARGHDVEDGERRTHRNPQHPGGTHLARTVMRGGKHLQAQPQHFHPMAAHALQPCQGGGASHAAAFLARWMAWLAVSSQMHARCPLRTRS